MTDAARNRQGPLSRRAVLGGGLRLARGAALLGGLGSVGESLFGAARASASTMPMMSTIKFQLGWLTNTEFAGTYLAASKGYFSKAGLDVTVLPGEGVDVEGIVGAGKALVGDSNADTCSAAVAQGADIYETTSSAITDHKEDLVEFLRAERKGWEADIANPAGGLALTMSTYGKKIGLDDKQQGLENKAQLPLIRTAYTETNGLFAMDPADIAKNLATLELAKSKKIGNYYTKADLFDDSILKAL